MSDRFRGRPFGMKRLLVASVAAALILSGCASSTPASEPQGTEVAAAAKQAVDPEELIGIWQVTDAEGVGPQTFLRLGRGLELANSCGGNLGDWEARDGRFIGSLLSSYENCDETVGWLARAAGYGHADDELALFDADGEHLATLIPGGDSSGFMQGELTDLERSGVTFDNTAALPEGAEPVTDLVGKWVPVDNHHDLPVFLNFRDNGKWNGLACNSMEGRWSVGADGSILATSGISGLIACVKQYPPAITWLLDATAIGMVGDELTLYGTDGAVLGALVRA